MRWGVMSSVGEQLRAAREARELTIEQVAQATKLKLTQIEALETGDYSAFPAPVYVRGSIRNYAEAVKIDPVPLIEQLKAETESRPIETPRDNPYVAKGDIDSLTWRLASVSSTVLPLALIVIVLLGGFLTYKVWHNYKTKDYLVTLGSGQYPDETQAEKIRETLPLPPVVKP